MDRPHRVEIPFRLNPAKGEPLHRQFADGIKAAISRGVYRPGALLPRVCDWAFTLGVSEFVPRRAYRQLAAEGVITVRRHLGARVSGRLPTAVRPRVLYVSSDDGSLWSRNVFSYALGNRLAKAGFRFRRVYLAHGDAALDAEELLEEIHRGVDYAVCEVASARLLDPLVNAGVPHLVIARRGGSFPAAEHVIWPDEAFPVAESVAALKAAGCRSTEYVAYERLGNAGLLRALHDAGFRYTTTVVPGSEESDSPARKTDVALTFFRRRLAAERRLPDVFILCDVFMTDGIFLALLEQGLRVPEDVKVLAISVKGLGPRYLCPITRVEADGTKEGRVLADWVVARLRGKKLDLPALGRRFIRGETL